MKNLIKSTLESGDFGWLQTFALVAFFGVMIGVFLWIYRPGSKDLYHKISTDSVNED